MSLPKSDQLICQLELQDARAHCPCSESLLGQDLVMKMALESFASLLCPYDSHTRMRPNALG